MKDYELSMSRFAQPFLFRIFMLCAYTRPRYQVSIYRTIGPLVMFCAYTRPRYQVSVYRTIGALVYRGIRFFSSYFCSKT